MHSFKKMRPRAALLGLLVLVVVVTDAAKPVARAPRSAPAPPPQESAPQNFTPLRSTAQAPGRVHGTQGAAPDTETIVYSSIQPSNWNLYLFESPGSEPRRLTTDPGLDYNAAISPDGRWVVFTSERSGNPDLYVTATRTSSQPGFAPGTRPRPMRR